MVINYCVLIAKYYIDIQNLVYNNNIEIYSFLVNEILQIEKTPLILCIEDSNASKSDKFYLILKFLWNVSIYSHTCRIVYICYNNC